MVQNKVIGRTISHYKILEKLGEGGMGVVYQAHDTRLDRTVALKFLPPHALGSEEEKTRLVHEAKAAAALQHPNICTVHEIGEAEGQTFIAMAYLPGQSLKDRIAAGPLAPAEAVDLAIQVSQGLQEAHAQGVVHRDIKPANIMISEQGQAVVMDFGLAKKTDATRLTRTGTTMGTAAYMSPEQVRGESVDHGSDIWSVGVLLHEMLTGQLPFTGESEPALMYSLLNSDPELPTALRAGVPPGLDAIVAKALAKDRGQRYPEISELVADLQELRADPAAFPAGKRPRRRLTRGQRLVWFGTAAVVLALLVVAGWRFWPGRVSDGQLIASLAVLPLQNLSGEEHEVYADGLTMELTSILGKIGDLRVVGRRSAMRFKGSDKPTSEIASELHVDALVEGSVQLVGDRIRITAELIHVARDEILWSDSFDGDLRDVLNMQKEMAWNIAREIKVQMTPTGEALLVETRQVDPEAYELYLKGRFYKSKFIGGNLTKGIEYLLQSLEKDPDYAPAYATLAMTYATAAFGGHIHESKAYPLAKEAAARALELDDTLAEAHAALGRALDHHDRDWVLQAEQHFRRALELDPGSLEANAAFAFFLNLNVRNEEAIDRAQYVMGMDPLSAAKSKNLFYIYLNARKYELARAQAAKTFELLQLYPDEGIEFLVRKMLPRIDILAGDYTEAQRQIDDLLSTEESLYVGTAQFAQAWLDAKTGKSERARIWLEGEHWEWNKAAMAVALGDKELAFEYLETLFANDEAVIEFIKMSPTLDGLHDDPRFDDLLRRVGFPLGS